MNDEDEDVFQVLLNDNDDCDRQTSRAVAKDKCEEDKCDFHLNYSVNPILPHTLRQIQSESHILADIHKQGLTVLDSCTDKNYLYALVESSYDLAVIHVYSLGTDITLTQKPKLSTILPTSLSSSLFKGVERSVVKHLYVIRGDVSFDASSSATVDPGCVHLPNSSFASMFGKSTCLTKSPVVILCTKDGCVFWRPLKCLGGEERFSAMCQLHSFVNSVLSVLVHKKRSDIDEDTAMVLEKALGVTSDAKMDGSGDCVIGLLAVCDIGECCVVLPMTKKNNRCDYFPVRFCLPQPVKHCVTRGNQIIYSTGWTVETATLAMGDKEKLPSVVLEKCDTLLVAKIEELSFYSSQGESEPTLMGLTSDHDRIPIPSTPASHHTSYDPSSGASHLFPETIQNINKHSTSIQALQTKCDMLDMNLLQLNLFASLCRQLHQHAGSASHRQSCPITKQNFQEQSSTPLIHCKCYFDHGRGYRKTSEVRVQIRNDSKVNLSAQWSVLVIIVPETLITCTKVCAKNFSFKMDGGLPVDCKKTFSVPVSEIISSDPTAKLTVRVCLVLSFQPDFSDSFTATLTAVNQCYCLDVEVYNKEFNILDFLRVSSDDDLSMPTRLGCFSNEDIKNFLDTLAETKVKKKSLQSVDSQQKTNIVTMTVPDAPGLDSEPDSTEEVLRMLLHNIGHFPDVNNPLVCQGLDGTKISFTLERIATQTDERGQRLQIKMKSLDIILLSVVHCNLLERLEGMSSKENERVTVSKLDLEKELSTLKSIKLQLSKTRRTDSRDGDAFSNLCAALDCLGQC